jgi:hypothetical protein
MMESLGLLLGEELGFLFFADCEEMICSWGGACSGDWHGEVINDFCHVFDYRYLCNARMGEIKVHSKVVMNWSVVDNKAVAIYCGKIGCKLRDLEGFDLWYIQVFHMPGDRHCFLPTVAFATQGLYRLITMGMSRT